MKLLMKIFSLLLLSYNVKNFPVIRDKNLFLVHKTILEEGRTRQGVGIGGGMWKGEGEGEGGGGRGEGGGY